MDLFFLDENFNQLNAVDYINLQWNRRYYECGQYSVQILAKDYQKSFRYAYRPSRKELGLVQQVQYTGKTNGEFVQISGFFLERILNDFIVYPTLHFNGNLGDCARKLLTDYCLSIPKLKIGNTNVPNTNITIQQTGAEASDQLYKILKEHELSYELYYNYINDNITFNIWSGLDRTQDQDVNETAIFSQAWNGLKEPVVTNDNSNYKNYAVVAGSGEGESRVHAIVDISNGEPLKRVYIDARDLQKDDKMTQDQYEQALIQRGKEKLAGYVNITNVEFESTGELVYKVNFDLGDKADIIINNIDQTYQSRIIGIDEVIKENRMDIKLLFGDKIPKK